MNKLVVSIIAVTLLNFSTLGEALLQVTSIPECNQTDETSCGNGIKISEWPSFVNNVTTIITLNTIVNTTETVNKPTKRENGESCCSVVRLKTCRKSIDGSKCRYRRHNTCGDICKSHTMHTKVKRKCRKRHGCHRQSVYIPEPITPPRCISIYRWPYLLCGTYPQSTSCDGCYTDYDYNSYGGNSECYGCYDAGLDDGQLYRRGPVLSPAYYHVPPCELIGTCGTVYIPVRLEYEYSDWDELSSATGRTTEYEGSGQWIYTTINSLDVQEFCGNGYIGNCSKPDVFSEKQKISTRRNVRNSKKLRRSKNLMLIDPIEPYKIPTRFYKEEIRPDYIRFVDDEDNQYLIHPPRSNKYTKKLRYRHQRFPIDEDDLSPLEQEIF